ncbi:MAG: hypothetical protein M3R08_07785, partial [Bacteroidota bacterium]|nr:hypothetical protein [Bacteroidota bacterium]
ILGSRYLVGMFRVVQIILFSLVATTAVPQYDVGFTGGVFGQKFSSDNFRGMPIPWSIGLFYRERGARHTDLSVELNFVNARLNGYWRDGGLASNTTLSIQRADLQYLQFSPYLDVRMGTKGNSVIRFGPQFSWKIAETFTGTRTSWSIMQGGTSTNYSGVSTDFFRDGEFRLMIGFGFRMGKDDEPYALMLDPYLSYGMSALIKSSYDQANSTIIGIRLGFGKRIHRKTFTRLLYEKTPEAPENAW